MNSNFNPRMQRYIRRTFETFTRSTKKRKQRKARLFEGNLGLVVRTRLACEIVSTSGSSLSIPRDDGVFVLLSTKSGTGGRDAGRGRAPESASAVLIRAQDGRASEPLLVLASARIGRPVCHAPADPCLRFPRRGSGLLCTRAPPVYAGIDRAAATAAAAAASRFVLRV